MIEDFEDENAKENHPRTEDEFYASLKQKLSGNHNFPEDYLFKFIIPSNSEKITEILRIFDGTKYTMSNRDSKNGNYTSISLNTFVLDEDQVIGLYKKVGKIEGVMML